MRLVGVTGRSNGSRVMFWLALAFLGTSLFPVSAMSLTYEPNNTTLEARGPLLTGQSVASELSADTDHDLYFFYVVSKGGTGDFAIGNLGGGPGASTINVAILDHLGTQVAAISSVRQGETRTMGPSLEPGKYYVEIWAAQGYGDTYSVTPLTPIVGPYEQISSHCASADARAKKAHKGLQKAETRLQHAAANRRLARFFSPSGRRAAIRAQLNAAKRVRMARRMVRGADQAREPWCSIAA